MIYVFGTFPYVLFSGFKKVFFLFALRLGTQVPGKEKLGGVWRVVPRFSLLYISAEAIELAAAMNKSISKIIFPLNYTWDVREN